MAEVHTQHRLENMRDVMTDFHEETQHAVMLEAGGGIVGHDGKIPLEASTYSTAAVQLYNTGTFRRKCAFDNIVVVLCAVQQLSRQLYRQISYIYS